MCAVVLVVDGNLSAIIGVEEEGHLEGMNDVHYANVLVSLVG